MSDTRINDLMLQMQALAAKASSGVQATPPAGEGADATAGTDFGALLKQSIDKVNETQTAAGELTARFEQGEPGVELGEVMVALQKADISFKAMTEVRNKLVDAYQEIMNMPV